MEIKRQLTALAKRMTPQIEVMNVATEIRDKMKRIDELITYAQTKIDRSAERKGKSLGVIADEQRKAADKVIEDHQTAEADENLKDQEEAFAERNKTLEKSQPTPIGTGGEPDPAEGNDELPPATPAKKEKKRAKKKTSK